MSLRLPTPSAFDPRLAAAPSLVVGIGCRSGVSLAQIDAAVRAALGSRAMSDIKRMATIDAKTREPALIEFCERHVLPLIAYSSDAINAYVDANTTLARSPAAARYLGVESVCEPCAMLGASGGTLIRGKIALDGVTVAIACEPSEEQAA